LTTGFLILAHKPLAQAAAAVVEAVYKSNPGVCAVDVDSDLPGCETERQIREACGRLSGICDRIVLIEDVCGATPANVAERMTDRPWVARICPLSLPLLLKLVNYRNKPLDELLQKAREVVTEAVLEQKSDC
jgi:mannose/fructose-specific phosphotransferase system component IIA